MLYVLMGAHKGKLVLFSFSLRRLPREQEKKVQTELQAYCSFIGL